MAEESIIRRVMPNSVEAEQSVIGSMIIDSDSISIASELISADDFYNKQYGVVFDAMVELNNEGKAVDIVTLQERLKERGAPQEVSSLEFIRDIITAVPTSANIVYYANIVSEKSTLRRLIRLSDEISNNCYDGKGTAEELLNDTEKRMSQLVQKRNMSELVPIRKVVSNTLSRIQAAYLSDGTVTGISTGFYDLDYMTSGMQPSDLVIIAARPAMGKTAFVLNVAGHMAFREKKHVMIFSLEMSSEQLVNRLFAFESRVDAQHLRNGKLEDSEWTKLAEAAGVVAGSNLQIDDTPGISIGELRSKCRKYKQEKGLDIVMIDYLQLMTGGGKSESRQQEISEISRSLKGLARELNVPVIALSQLSRTVEQRPDKRPMMSDLRESGAIEQDADMVMFIYRDDYYNKDSEKKNVAEIIIGKQRHGPVGTVDLAWLPEYTKFANLEKTRKHED